ncbi:MAG: energy-coupled thiamine transporter ThiT [Saccharofermentans sp.]|nr:energy-coupled thiamine transporter ThiT [Saccharofermentans sp.]
MAQTLKVSKSRMLAEGAIMLALATVLSLLKILDLPYGGSVTVACMLPCIIISYRYGLKFGALTGLVFAIMQQLLGLKNLSYFTTWQSVVAIILLDYIVAFGVVCFGGLFRKISNQATGLMLGSILVCILRFICHTISGATVWAGLSIPTNAALIYSIGYNATYMVPETIVTALAAYYIGSVIDFREASIKHVSSKGETKAPYLKWIAGLVVVGALVFDIVSVFMHLQNAETGDFDITGLASANWTLVAIVSAAALVIAGCLFIISSKKNKNA